jgi:hypothetical protein
MPPLVTRGQGTDAAAAWGGPRTCRSSNTASSSIVSWSTTHLNLTAILTMMIDNPTSQPQPASSDQLSRSFLQFVDALIIVFYPHSRELRALVCFIRKRYTSSTIDEPCINNAFFII